MIQITGYPDIETSGCPDIGFYVRTTHSKLLRLAPPLMGKNQNQGKKMENRGNFRGENLVGPEGLEPPTKRL